MITNLVKSIFNNLVTGVSVSLVKQCLLLGVTAFTFSQLFVSTKKLKSISNYEYVVKKEINKTAHKDNFAFDQQPNNGQHRKPSSSSSKAMSSTDKTSLKINEKRTRDFGSPVNGGSSGKGFSGGGGSVSSGSSLNESRGRRGRSRYISSTNNSPQSLASSNSGIGSSSLNFQNTGDFQVVTNSPFDVSIGGDLNCYASKAGGTYTTGLSVNLSCSETANIKYCINTGAGFCNPTSSSSIYSQEVLISSIENTYGLSFYGETSTGKISNVVDLSYTISSSVSDGTYLPQASLVVHFPLINLQTTQLPLISEIQSPNFGMDDYYYHQLNFKGHDPTSTGLNWSCSQMLNSYSSLSSPSVSVIETNFSLGSLPDSGQIDQSIDLPRLDAGDNYILTFIEDRANSSVSCQSQKVIVNDFFITSFGSFNPYGHFQIVPNSSPFGQGRSPQGNTVNSVGIKSITY